MVSPIQKLKSRIQDVESQVKDSNLDEDIKSFIIGSLYAYLARMSNQTNQRKILDEFLNDYELFIHEYLKYRVPHPFSWNQSPVNFIGNQNNFKADLDFYLELIGHCILVSRGKLLEEWGIKYPFAQRPPLLARPVQEYKIEFTKWTQKEKARVFEQRGMPFSEVKPYLDYLINEFQSRE